MSLLKLTRERDPRCCPRCAGNAVMRSSRRGVLGLPVIRRLGLSFYRCGDCWKRFIRPGKY